MTKTKVVNRTHRSIILKEGTAGVYRRLCDNLEAGKTFKINVDTNATYREYWCASTPDDDNHIVLSSDDCVEYQEVRIRTRPDNTYTWDAVKRSTREFVENAGERDPSTYDARAPAPAPALAPAPAPALAHAHARPHAQPGVDTPVETEGAAHVKEPGVAGKWWSRLKFWN